MKAVAATAIQSLAFVGANSRYATHHMHPYVAAMVPALARKIIRMTEPTSILDPFCGGGRMRGRHPRRN